MEEHSLRYDRPRQPVRAWQAACVPRFWRERSGGQPGQVLLLRLASKVFTALNTHDEVSGPPKGSWMRSRLVAGSALAVRGWHEVATVYTGPGQSCSSCRRQRRCEWAHKRAQRRRQEPTRWEMGGGPGRMPCRPFVPVSGHGRAGSSRSTRARRCAEAWRLRARREPRARCACTASGTDSISKYTGRPRCARRGQGVRRSQARRGRGRGPGAGAAYAAQAAAALPSLQGQGGGRGGRRAVCAEGSLSRPGAGIVACLI
jgi:hypothetical protein